METGQEEDEEDTKIEIIQPKRKIDEEDFEKIRLIGRGDVGKVYLVRHKDSKQLHAMKVLGKQEMIKRNKVKRVLTEREILSTTNHPFIVTLYWSFQSPTSLYFVMDYCAGGEFFRMLQRRPGRCLPEDHVRFYAAEVLLALEYLHMLGFVYRDLKPENILLHASGHIMLTDFDLSKAAASQVTPQVIKKMFSKQEHQIYSTPKLVTNSFVGTAEYIAPEIIKGYGQASAVDWWTFGILMYEMLTGTTPFKGDTQDRTFEKILEGELKFESAHPISSTCRSLIKKLLNPDPKKRIGSVHGAQDVKKHKFFDKTNFTLIRNETPPIIPVLENPLDTSNFRTLKDSDDAAIKLKDSPTSEETEGKEDAFKDFRPIERKPKDPNAL